MALDPPPPQSPIVDRPPQPPNWDWTRWFLALWSAVRAQPLEIGLSSTGAPPVNLTGQTAAIATTPIPLPTINGGAYRVTWYTRKTVADGFSSSLTITIGWTESGIAQTRVGAALATDTVLAIQSESVMFLNDQSTAITYAVAYASNTPNKMTYRLSVLVEEL